MVAISVLLCKGMISKLAVYYFVASFPLYMSFGSDEFLYEPSFISDWYEVQTGQQSSSSLNIPHNRGEYPVKVDVQVKIVEGGKEYIFSGLGSSQRDDDVPDDYGAVIYRYNDSHVQIGLPFRNNGFNHNFGLAYTGTGILYDGPTKPKGPYVNGKVRVRVWLSTDMPELVFNLSTRISNDKRESYQELQHGLGFYPDIVRVQTKMDDRYMSDGIGVIFFDREIIKSFSSGGVLFGYDDKKVRLWTPFHQNGRVFFGSDGYSLGDSVSGKAFVLGWRIVTAQQVFHSKQSVGGTNNHDSVVSFPGSLNWRNYLVSVQYKIPCGYGPNGGMVFYAAGTTQASIKAGYGGIVYAYTQDAVMLWNPKGAPIVNIGGMWDKRHVTKSYCNNTNSLTDIELQEIIESMKVDTKTTSAYIRRKTCAADDRSSARTIGLAGAFVLTSVFGFIVIPDILSIFRYLGVVRLFQN